jgi:hypothetical protein
VSRALSRESRDVSRASRRSSRESSRPSRAVSRASRAVSRAASRASRAVSRASRVASRVLVCPLWLVVVVPLRVVELLLFAFFESSVFAALELPYVCPHAAPAANTAATTPAAVPANSRRKSWKRLCITSPSVDRLMPHPRRTRPQTPHRGRTPHASAAGSESQHASSSIQNRCERKRLRRRHLHLSVLTATLTRQGAQHCPTQPLSPLRSQLRSVVNQSGRAKCADRA